MDEQAEQVVRLVARHHDDLFRYIFAILPSESDALDVLQETATDLWRKADGYDPSRPFLPWAQRFAYLNVLKHKTRRGKGPRLFSDDMLDLLARQHEEQAHVLHARLQALDRCLEELPAADRLLIQHRYYGRLTAEDMIERLGVSRRKLYRQLDRVRRWLFECINRRVRLEEIS